MRENASVFVIIANSNLRVALGVANTDTSGLAVLYSSDPILYRLATPTDYRLIDRPCATALLALLALSLSGDILSHVCNPNFSFHFCLALLH